MKYILCLLIFIVIIVWGIIAIGFYLSPQDKLGKAESIVVVSGGETKTRTKEGVSLYLKNYSSKLIFSGAARDQKKSGISNAQMMADIASELGVEKDDMILEEQSQTTYENAQRVKKILEKNNWNSLILVTSPYHQKRAYFCFKRALGENYQIINHSATDSVWRKNGWWKTRIGWYLTLNELQKILYLYITGNYD